MTDRLYYTDAYLAAFDAVVQSAVTRTDGRAVVTLDRTAFYPTSGGQPFDTGRLGACTVVDVVDAENGSVEHVVEGTAPAVGSAVHGTIDWARRFDHMQQHTGQHVLSAAFDRLFRVRTESFHLGSEASTIDLAREVSAAEMKAAEDAANQVVWSNTSVGVRFVSAEEAASLPLRKEPQRTGALRLVEVPDFDLSACGGTHVSRTGGIGVIAIAGAERFKGGQRVEFVCGGRALARFRALREATAAAMRLLSVGGSEIPDAIERLSAENREQRRALAAQAGELARYRAEALAAGATTTAHGLLVASAVDADAGGLKALAAAIVAKPGHFVVLVSNTTPALAVIARSADARVAANQVLAELLRRFGGKGGGRPDFAQGGGMAAPAADVLAAATAILDGISG